MFHYEFILQIPNPLDIVFEMENCPYIREEGGGQEGYQNVHFMSLFGGGGRGLK